MQKAPKEHYISAKNKEVVLVWSFPNLITLQSNLFALGIGLFFALLLMLETNNFPRAALVGFGITSAIFIWNFLKQQVLNSDRFRLALAFSSYELGTQGYFWTYTIPWSKVKKIQCSSAQAISLPVSHFQFWIYPENKMHRFVSIPKLTEKEYQGFFEILQLHTKRNSVKLTVI